MSASHFTQLFSQKRILLDGGLASGTTLEEDFGLNISDTSLWSARAISEHPEILSRAHAAFSHAGADIVSTATYQCSFETFRIAEYSDDEATQFMREAVNLAHRAVVGTAKVALSLGPFGASLSPAQEFDGCYPPPFGPQKYRKGAREVNLYKVEDQDLELASIEALADFHLKRLRVFADDEEIWTKIDIVSFETVPLVREVVAIRLAMHRLYSPKPIPPAQKPWWISTVWPNGQSPQKSSEGNQAVTTPSDVFRAVFSQKMYPSANSENNLASPSAVGINCTALADVVTIAGQFTEALRMCEDPGLPEKPWLVMYPNGGDVYDIETQKWIATESNSKESWAQQMNNLIGSITGKNPNLWGGIIVGGCCRTGAKDIESLRGLIDA